ncbi:MAG: S41 family peptidase [Solirubrobacteraceae bacterium]
MRRARNIPLMPLALLLPVMFLAGIWIGGHPGDLPRPVRSLFVGTEVSTLQAALDIIEHDYYRPVDRRKLLHDGLAGAVADLHDRFSRYLDPPTYRRFQADSTGRFSGVGMEVAGVKSGLRVSRVFSGSPAAKAGIRHGDEIVRVNGRSIAGRSISQTTALIRGRPGTFVVLTVLSHGHPRMERLRRRELIAPVVSSSLRTLAGHRIAVVALSQFSSGSHAELRRAVDRERTLGAQGIVLDLRDDGGGLLTEAVQVSSIFIPHGTIVSTRARTRARHVYQASGSSIPRSVPVVVLVNGGTASASEIVAGALQDHHRALVVGTHTYGKGVYQEIRELPNGGAIDITVGEYFTPSGRNLGAGGIRRGPGVRPDLTVRDRPDTGTDEALDAALHALAARIR